MIDDPDICRAAKLVMDQPGGDAATYTAGREDEYLKGGDLEGAAVWRRILAAIKELQGGRKPDEVVN